MGENSPNLRRNWRMYFCMYSRLKITFALIFSRLKTTLAFIVSNGENMLFFKGGNNPCNQRFLTWTFVFKGESNPCLHNLQGWKLSLPCWNSRVKGTLGVSSNSRVNLSFSREASHLSYKFKGESNPYLCPTCMGEFKAILPLNIFSRIFNVCPWIFSRAKCA